MIYSWLLLSLGENQWCQWWCTSRNRPIWGDHQWDVPITALSLWFLPRDLDLSGASHRSVSLLSKETNVEEKTWTSRSGGLIRRPCAPHETSGLLWRKHGDVVEPKYMRGRTEVASVSSYLKQINKYFFGSRHCRLSICVQSRAVEVISFTFFLSWAASSSILGRRGAVWIFFA